MKYDIIVCGDSFSAALHNGSPRDRVRDHYSQLLQDRYGYSVLCLARGAMSNLGICFQMREAIKIGCKYLLYHSTWGGRVNLILNDHFVPELGLKNFVYPFSVDESSYCEYVGHNEHMTLANGVRYPNNNASVFSTVTQGLSQNPAVHISKDQIEAIDGYLIHLFNEGLQKEVDGWMFEYWANKAKDAGIIPIDMKSPVGQLMFDYVQTGKPEDDNPYHTDRITQEKIAKNVHETICEIMG